MIDLLVRASVEGAILAAAVWLLLRIAPGIPPSVKALLWWGAAARVVLTLVALPPLLVPVLPPVESPATIVPSRSLEAAAGVLMAAEGMPERSSQPVQGWTRALVASWAGGFAISVLLACGRWRRLRRVISRSGAVPDELSQLTGELGTALAVTPPRLRASAEITSPLVTGLWRPTMLVPASFMSLSLEERRIAICHELIHLRRRDLWLGCVPAAAERLFFFHPLVRFAVREFAFWREAACDAAVLRALGTTPASYGRLLLSLGITPTRRSVAAAGASWSVSTMKRRILMLERVVEPTRRTRLGSSAALATMMLALVPLQLTPRAVSPSGQPLQPVAQQPAGPRAVDIAASLDQDATLRFVYFVNGDTTTMSGRSEDLDRARGLRQGNEPLFWFVQSGREYVIRDAAVLREIHAAWRPVSDIGDEQAGVGARQARIGARQAEIGARQAAVGAEQADLGARQAAIAARQAAAAAREAGATTAADRNALVQERRSLDADMRRLDEKMRMLDEKMRALDPGMRDLDDDMRVLDREMRRLDAKMREAEARTQALMRALIGRAIASGAAQPVG